MKKTYYLGHIYRDNNGKNHYVIWNPQDSKDLKEDVLRTKLRNNEIEINNIDENSLQVLGNSFSLERIIVQNLAFSLGKFHADYPLLPELVNLLKQYNKYNSLSIQEYNFVKDLLDLLSKYFNYLRNTNIRYMGKIFGMNIKNPTEFFKTQIKFNGKNPHFSKHTSDINTFRTLQNANISVYITKFIEKLEEDATSYDNIIKILEVLWKRNNSNRVKTKITVLLNMMLEFFNSVCYSFTGQFLYIEYMNNVCDACVVALQRTQTLSSTVEIKIPSINDDKRDKIIKSKLGWVDKKYWDSVKDLERKCENLNVLSSRFGNKTLNLLESLPDTKLNLTDKDKKKYFSVLKETKKETESIFDSTKYIMSKYEEETSISKFRLIVEGLIMTIATVLEVDFLASGAGIIKNVLGAACIVGPPFLDSKKLFNIACRNFCNDSLNSQSIMLMKKLKELNTFEINVMLYKLNKIRYQSTKEKDRENFVYQINGERDLLPMLYITTKNRDNCYNNINSQNNIPYMNLDRKFKEYPIKGEIYDLHRNNELDVCWCTLYLHICQNLRISSVMRNNNATISWLIFKDIMDEFTDERLLNSIQKYLKDEYKWSINRNPDKLVVESRMLLK